MTDKILAISALAVLTAFILTIVVFVPEPDLTIVSIVTLAMAGLDFYRSTFRNRGKTD